MIGEVSEIGISIPEIPRLVKLRKSYFYFVPNNENTSESSPLLWQDPIIVMLF